jgi:hypothetical protein
MRMNGRRRSPSLPLLVPLPLLLPASCFGLRSFPDTGPMVEREFSVASGDVDSADVDVGFWGGEFGVVPMSGKVMKDEPIAVLVARDNLLEFDPRCDQVREGRHVSARLWIDTDKNVVARDGEGENEWRVTLGRSVPLDLTLQFVAGAGEVDLGGVPLRRARVSLAAGKSTLRFSKENPETLEHLAFEVRELGNARARSIRVEAGAGSFLIDCGGRWRGTSLLRVDAGLCGLEIRVPADLAVKVAAVDAAPTCTPPT